MGLEKRDSKRRTQALLDSARPSLTVDEERILKPRFGLSDGIDHSLREIAQVLNLSLTRTRSLSDSAIRKVKRGAGAWTEPLVKNTLDSGLWKVKAGQGQRTELRRVLSDPARWTARIDVAKLRISEIFGGAPAAADPADLAAPAAPEPAAQAAAAPAA